MLIFFDVRTVFSILAYMVAVTAKAQEVEQGASLYLQPNFEEAAVLFESVLQKRSLKVAEAALAHAYLATIHSAWGHAVRAEQEAFAALTLDPNVSMPDGATLEVVRLFQDARVRSAGSRLEVDIAPEREPVRKNSRVRIAAHLVPFAELAASVLRLECSDGKRKAHAQGGSQGVTLELQPADLIRCTAVAENRAGALLVQTTQEIPVASSLLQEPLREPRPSSNAKWWWIGTGIGVAVAAAATTLAVVLIRSDNPRARIDQTVIDGW